MHDSEKAHEESRLMATSPLTYAAIFNDLDLTYSDDDETDDFYWDMTELGASGGSMSSPDTAALLDEIQNAMFPENSAQQQQQQQQQQEGVTQQQQQQSLHLMHPLAAMPRQPSHQSSEGDELSCLAYSINSLGTDESSSRQQQAASAVAPHVNYGSLGSASDATALGSPLGFKAKNTPLFQPSSSQPKLLAAANLMPASSHHHNPQIRPSSRLKPRPSRVENMHPNPSSTPHPSTSTTPSRSSHSNGSKAGTMPKCYPQTPIPFIANESPVTSATATDATRSPEANHPSTATAQHGPHDASPENQRMAIILGQEATKRVKRHRRLRRIRKAAEMREAAVRKVRGLEQPAKCNDALFAVLFLLQFLLVSVAAVALGPGALRDKIYGSLVHREEDGEEAVVDYNPFAGLQTDDVIIMNDPLRPWSGHTSGIHHHKEVEEGGEGISHIDYVNVLQLVCIASGYASLCSLLALGFLMMLSKNLLQATLLFAIGVSLAWTVLGLAFSPSWIITLIGMVVLTCSFFYTVVVWDRISFATINLSVALKGMRSTLDIPFVAFFVLALTFLWTIWWMCAFIGAFDFLNDDADLSNDWMRVLVGFFLFSYYWTFQVIKGISQTSVASIIGKWWDVSEEDQLPVIGSVLHSTLHRNIIGSFGSLCLGSLIVGPCILLTRFSTFTRLVKPRLTKLKATKLSDAELDGKCSQNASSCSPHNSYGIISRNVNQWSFTYIGLYGYKFLDSGSKASQLFEARGWTHVVSDDLIMTVMTMVSLIIGGSTGCLGIIVEEVDGYSLTSLHQPITTAFLISSFIGYFLSSAFLSVVEGSVSAILVCYAAAPVEFHANHHKLSEEMKSAWKHFWLQKPLPPS